MLNALNTYIELIKNRIFIFCLVQQRLIKTSNWYQLVFELTDTPLLTS